ncbi:hypothetical protein APHAL10511_008466 [Amanita phalloides]|nr:hypothetical protein APHAL10511_008466 [Amanita phalloides]
MGSYLDRRDDSSDSHTIAVTAHIRTKTERLDIPDNKKFIRLAGEQIQQNGATHVITAIEYGGHIVGTFKQGKTSHDSEEKIDGRFLMQALRGMGKIFEVNGEAVLNLEDKKKLDHFDCEVRLLADIYLKSVLPTNAFEVLATVMRANQAIGDGVPLNVYLTSLKRFKDRFSAVSLVQQLDTAQLNEILHFYDKYITLNQDRTFLREQMDQHYKSYFPSFTAVCRAKANAVGQDLRNARRELRYYLQSYLKARPGSVPNADYLTDARERYSEAFHDYEIEKGIFDDLVQRKKAADDHGFELVDVTTLKKLMNRTDNATIALVIIPEAVHHVNLLNIHRVLADDIREWRRVEDNRLGEGDESEKTIYRSLYADPRIDNTLLLLDDANGTLMATIKRIRESKETGFLTFGVASKKLGELEWNSMNRDGWGTLTNKEEKWRYIGNVRDGLRHGPGVITYADDTRYAGSWYKGRREGLGKLISKSGAGEECVYINDRVRKDGVVVDATVFRNDVPIKFASVALGGHDNISAHVSKIADVFGWTAEERFDVILESIGDRFEPESVVVDGTVIDPSAADKARRTWPLDAPGRKVIKANIIP